MLTVGTEILTSTWVRRVVRLERGEGGTNTIARGQIISPDVGLRTTSRRGSCRGR